MQAIPPLTESGHRQAIDAGLITLQHQGLELPASWLVRDHMHARMLRHVACGTLTIQLQTTVRTCQQFTITPCDQGNTAWEVKQFSHTQG